MRIESHWKAAARPAVWPLLLAAVVVLSVAGAQELPVAAPALRLMPAQTSVALGVPPVATLEQKLVPALDSVAPELEVQALLNDFIRDFGGDFGVADAKSLADIGAGIGIDFNAPMAVFVDFAPSLDSLEELMKKLQEAEESPDLSPEEVFAEHMEIPAMALVMRLSDQAKAEAAIAKVGEMSPDFNPEGYENVTAGDVTVRSWGEDVFCYFISEDALVLGNSLDMVAATAMRLNDPAELRYGSDSSVPVVSPDELVALIYGGDFVPALMGILSTLMREQEPAMAKIYDAQLEMLSSIWKDEGEKDPLIMSLGMDGNRLELMTRIDTALHPAILQQSGSAVPLSLAPLLSKDTLAMLTLVLTDEMKQTIAATYLPALTAAAPADPQIAQAITIGRQVLQMVGPELAIGLASATDDLPAIVLMIQLTNPDATKGLLQLFVPTMPGETHNGVEIADVAAGLPVALSMAFVGNAVLVSNNMDEIKRIIDLQAGEGDSGLFASLDPPMDAKQPRYSVFMVKTKLYTDVILPLTMLFGGVPDEADMVLGQISGKISELRAVSEMRDAWAVSAVSFMFK
jgi:hypothetical protein